MPSSGWHVIPPGEQRGRQRRRRDRRGRAARRRLCRRRRAEVLLSASDLSTFRDPRRGSVDVWIASTRAELGTCGIFFIFIFIF